MRDLISKGLLTAAAATSVLSMSGYAHASDASGAAVGSPGVLSGNNIQVPVDVPVNVCGNSVDVVGLVNPTFGNTCVNASGTHHQAPHATQSTHSTQSTRPVQTPQHGPAVHTAPAPRPAAENSPAYGDAPSHHAPSHQAPSHHAPSHELTPGSHSGGAVAEGSAVGSPGVGSGNLIDVPLDIPLNVCGDSIDVVGLLNPAFGNKCEVDAPVVTPPVAPPAHHLPPAPHHPAEHQAVPPPPHLVPNAPEPAPPVVHPHVDSPAEPAQLAATGADDGLLVGGAMSAALLIGGGILYRRSTASARV
ncbi:chaplin family protein [Streptomyces sp. NPDC088725]|uniref:chaplin n=1 Tax=Streptomyces sp. NPDC088725 TaxID=3365873 RepID=UPI00381ACA97